MTSVGRMALFAIVAGGLVTGLHVYLYLRLVRDTTASRRVRVWAKAVIAALAVALFASRFVYAHLPRAFVVPYATSTWLWMGVATYLVLTFAAVGLARRGFQLGVWALRAVGRAPEAPPDPGRRLFVSRVVAGSAVAATAGFVAAGAWRCFQPPKLTEVALKLPGLPRSLDGFRLVQLSDVHVGGILERRFVRELVQRCNAEKPDLHVITGDLVDGDVPTLGPAIAELRGLESRHGTFFCTGNHEYYSGVDEWAAALPGFGVTVLRNRFVEIGDPGASFDLVGVDDWGHRGLGGYDLQAATAGRDPARPAVLLAHQPQNFEAAIARGVGLQLSGHTHGGQFFPGTAMVSLLWRFPAGHFTVGDRHIFVSRGTGFWGPPLRLGSAAEIVVVTLLA